MKNYFIGIDVSKEKIDVAVVFNNLTGAGIQKLQHTAVENSESGFKYMLRWVAELTAKSATADNTMFCCETTGGYDIRLCSYLHEHGWFIWRESALQIKRSSGLRRGKDDVADSWTIAMYACRYEDMAVEFNPMLPEVRALKALVNYRDVLVGRMTSAKVRIKELKCTSLPQSSACGFIQKDAEEEIANLRERIKKCDKEILSQISQSEEMQRTYSHITSIPGIGPVNASALIAYTNNFRNFRTARALATYMGLVAFREQSGTSVNRSVNVGCYSNRQLKAYISQAACSAICYNHDMAVYYHRLTEGRGKHPGIALNNVKNKLVHIIFSLVKNDCDYEENHEYVLKYQKSKAS